ARCRAANARAHPADSYGCRDSLPGIPHAPGVDMAISMDGLASKLDTSAIINALMDVEKIPRTLLSAKSDDRKFVISQLQSLNASLQDLFAKAKAATAPAALGQMTATSSDPDVKIVTRAGATPLSTQIVVDRAATAHSV